MRRFRLFTAGGLLMLGGAFLAHVVQTAGGTTIEDVRFDGGNGVLLSALLYKPLNASEATPAPAVLAVHGYINSRETQSAFAIEFARRGYVVLAIDQTGHGFSDGAAFSAGYGGPAALRYLRSLSYVDGENVALTGHSMGGWAGLSAAAAMPDAYRSVVLVGSSTGPGYAPEGSTTFPRNLGVVFSRYDEFSMFMWGVENAADVTTSTKLKSVFGSDADIVPRQVYGDIAAGSARWLATPATTHPGDHLSRAAVADTLAWVGMTLDGGRALRDFDQRWYWKEAGTLSALLGGLALLLGAMTILLSLPAFSAGAQPGVGHRRPVGGRWWLGLAMTSAVPAITYFPLMRWAAVFEASPWFPQAVTNRILCWALLNALVAGLFSTFSRGRGRTMPAGVGDGCRSVAVALISVLFLYAAVAALQAWLAVDLRFWVVALKPLADHHVATFAAYLLPFTVFFAVTQACWFRNSVPAKSAKAQYAGFVLSTTGAFAAMVCVLYAWLFAFGRLPGVDPLYAIVAIQFVPVLAASAIIAVFAWRRTGNVVTGAVACGLLVTWYVVAGQATHL